MTATLLAVAACGNSSPGASAGRPASTELTTSTAPEAASTVVTARPTTRRSSAPSARVPAPTARPPAPEAPDQPGGPCATAQLRVEPVAVQPKGSTLVETFLLTNTGPNACSLVGPPGVAPFRASGSSVQANVIPIPPGEGAIGGPGGRLVIERGDNAVFFLQWSPTTPPGDCQDVDGILFDAPGSTSSSARIPFAIRFCGRLIRRSVVLPPGTA